MLIVKRLTPEDRADALYGDGWKRALLHPSLRAITSYSNPVSAKELLSWAAEGKKSPRVMSLTLEQKSVLFVFCSVMWRGAGASPLTDPEYSALMRHLYSGRQLDSLEAVTGVSFVLRQVVLWDMPALARKYRKKGMMPLPELPKPTKKVKRLRKHRKPA